MSNESNTDWVWKQHTVSGTQFILEYETFGPKGYADKISRFMQIISQGKPAQKAILDGIFRTNIKLVIEYAKKAQAEKDPSGRVHLIKFDPDEMDEEVLSNIAIQKSLSGCVWMQRKFCCMSFTIRGSIVEKRNL